VATISRMLKNIGLFCKRALQKRPIFCKETYIFKHPTHRSHPIGSLQLQVSFAEYRLFNRSLLQKRPMILRSLSYEATPYPLSRSISFPISLSDTHTFSPTLSPSLSRARAHALSLSLSFSFSFFLSFSHTLVSLSHTHTHTHILSKKKHTISLTYTHSLSFSLSLSHTHRRPNF